MLCKCLCGCECLGELLVEVFSLCGVGGSGERGRPCVWGDGTSFNFNCGLNKEMVGSQSCTWVDCDVHHRASQCLGNNDVIQLNKVPIRPSVSEGLRRGFLHPGLWEAEVVISADSVKHL